VPAHEPQTLTDRLGRLLLVTLEVARVNADLPVLGGVVAPRVGRCYVGGRLMGGGLTRLGRIAMSKTLYARLGGYDGIAAVADDLLPRLASDPQLERFWKHRGEDGVRREKQLLIDFLCASAGGPLYYVGRDMKTSHRGLSISERDWQLFIGHLNATLDKFRVATNEKADVLAFIESTKKDIVE
jgi:hemoglobin